MRLTIASSMLLLSGCSAARASEPPATSDDAGQDATIADVAPDGAASAPEDGGADGGADATTAPAACAVAPPSPAFVHSTVRYINISDSRGLVPNNYAGTVAARLGSVPQFANMAISGLTPSALAADFGPTRAAILDGGPYAIDAPPPVCTIFLGLDELDEHDAGDLPATEAAYASVIAQAHDAGAYVIAIREVGNSTVDPVVLAAFQAFQSDAGADAFVDLCGDVWSAAVPLETTFPASQASFAWTGDGTHGSPAFEACQAEALYPTLVQAFVKLGAVAWDGGP
jgi:hypothetical protein